MATLIDQHLSYVDNAMACAQKRQQKLWKMVNARRDKGGRLPLTDEALDEYIEAARMTASLMIDIEMVRDEWLAEKSTPARKGRTIRPAAKGRTSVTRRSTAKKTR